MFQIRSVLAILVIFAYLLYCAALKGRNSFEVVLENAEECKKPNPPYSKRVTVIFKYKLNIVDGRRYLSGNSIISAPIPFKNFSGRTFAVDNAGRRTVKMQVSEVSCQNIFAKTLLKFVNTSISMKNCMLQKGNYRYENLDLNKIMHAIPVWHAPGIVLHQLQLVVDGVTELCSEITGLIK